MSASKVKTKTNLSNGFGLTPGTTQARNFAYTKGATDTWHDEIIHVSKDKINKINNFLGQYDGGGREIEPEVY